MTNSKRKYTGFIMENDFVINADICLRNITEPKKNDFEYIYSLAEILDDVLDLQILGVLKFQPNRDDRNSSALLIRTA